MTDTATVQVKTLPNFEGLDLPHYATEHSAGMDFYAAIDAPITIKPGERTLIPTGMCIALPEGYELQIRSRSGLSLKNGIICLNSPATIDADYRGEIGIILANMGQEAFTVERGMRVAQMVIARYTRAEWDVTEELSETVRGAGGFGSTGVQKAG